MNEFELISKNFLPLAKNNNCALGLKDDCALIDKDETSQYVITKDIIVENVHFLSSNSADIVASKLLGVNLSDLASMGAIPKYYFLGLCLPNSKDEQWLNVFSQAFKETIDKFGGFLIGGDTVKTNDSLTLSLTAIGEVQKGKALLRSGARNGDDIYVSGFIGDSFLGLQLAKKKEYNTNNKDKKYLLNRYNHPTPRLQIGKSLVGIANSCIDVSDGLIADLEHLCNASEVGCNIKLENIPISDFAKKLLYLHDKKQLVTAGDDYELLFTASDTNKQKIMDISNILQVPITKIGTITKEKNINIYDTKNQIIQFEKSGYKHM